MRLRGALLLATTLALGGALPLAAAVAAPTPTPTPKASLSDVEDEIMCPSCHEPLALAQSPQAIAERNFIRMLIAHGQTKSQIKQALVAQYGPAVLARPPASGFNLTVYVLPPVLLIAGVALLIITLPRWRRRARARQSTTTGPAGPQLNPEDARRLDEELARFG